MPRPSWRRYSTTPQPVLGDEVQRPVELLAAVALEAAEHLAGQALGVDAHRHALRALHLAHHQRHVLPPVALVPEDDRPERAPRSVGMSASENRSRCWVCFGWAGPGVTRVGHVESVSRCGPPVWSPSRRASQAAAPRARTPKHGCLQQMRSEVRSSGHPGDAEAVPPGPHRVRLLASRGKCEQVGGRRRRTQSTRRLRGQRTGPELALSPGSP